MKKKVAQPKYMVPALDKGLDILEALSQTPIPQTMADIARVCNRSRSELFRMVDTLERRSYINRDSISGAYQLTLKLYELAHTHSPVDALLKASYYPMRELAETLHESCHLCILRGDRLLVIAEAESPMPVRLSIEIGYTALPLTTVSGKLLVAALDETAREVVLQADPDFMKAGEKRRKEYRAALDAIRENRSYKAPSTVRTGIDVSCLVGSPELGVCAALGVPFIAGGRNKGKEDAVIPVIMKHADNVTKAIGLGTLRTYNRG